jgi:putative FmdB family regulatory protein
MPTYEYVCRACRHEFERFQPITSSPVRTCPKCGRKRVERKIGIGAAVLFKGGGFYETDYRSESYRKTEEAEKKESEKASDKASDKASEKKPAESAKTTDSKVAPAAKGTDKPAEKAAAASTISESKSQASSQASSPASKETPAMPREKQEKKSAREGRGVGNLKQLAKTPSRASKPARKTKK